MSTPRFVSTIRLAAVAALAAALAPAAPAQTYGDRQLLSTAGGDPYVMILFDTSGSMNWATACDAEDQAAGRCSHSCEEPNCPQPLNGDDPNSKIFQAKQALYEVIKDVTGVRWGFASLNQDQLTVAAKHWLYEVSSVSVSGAATPAIPAVGWQEVFGPRTGGTGSAAFNIECDRKNPGSDDNNAALYETGCYMTSQDAPLTSTTDAWELNKLKRLPKGGANGQTTTVYYMLNPGNGTQPYYRFTYGATGSAVDYSTTDTLTVPVTIESCPGNRIGNDKTSCTQAWTFVATRTLTYTKVGQFLYWEGTPNDDSDLSKNAYFGGRTDGEPESLTGVNWANAVWADKTCRGWEPNDVYPGQTADITETDPFSSYNLRFSTDAALVFDPPGTTDDWIFKYGDMIPLDWNDNNHTAVLERLNPKHPSYDENSPEDYFGQAPFLADAYSGTETFLRLKNENQRPLMSLGGTPLAGWFSMFRRWYSGCGDPGNCDDENTGWADIAAQYDPTFNCSKKYVLMITDGEESCDDSPQAPAEDYYEPNIEEFPDGFSKTADQCRYRASLSAQEDIETLVIGFGTENKAKLQCANTPVFYADTKGELVDLLEKLIGEILEQAASFASAAVPTVQANIADKVYLSSFIPLEDEAIWPGRLDAFLKPLPLDATNLPDRNLVCQAGDKSSCFAWDAGDSQLAFDDDAEYAPQGLLLQAPLESEIQRTYDAAGNDSLQIGTDADERRVFFGRPDGSDAGLRRYFQYPTDNAGWVDLAYVWNIPLADASNVSNSEKDEMAEIIEFTLEEKQALITDPDTGDETKIQYVMGDIFHSNPVVINPPADFELFTKDLYWGKSLCGESVEDTQARGAQISYSWYSNKNLCRRVLLTVGSNDGQLHMFDGGIIRDVQVDDPDTPEDESVPADCLLNVPSSSSSRLAGLFDDDSQGGDYDNGSGREIFSFIPQAMMPVVKELSEIDELTTQYGVDGTVRLADVFIDPVVAADDPSTPSDEAIVTCTERAWRTVLLGSYREGGPGIFALDITQPDVFDSDNIPRPLDASPAYVPSCIDGGVGCDEFCASSDAECAALPFPALKWEFRDLDANGAGPADDDANGEADLAESWSRPLVFRLPVCSGECDTDAEPEDRWVAVFGGGLSEDPSNDSGETSGNWVYMVDIETGKLLYKRGGTGASAPGQIVGSVASDVTGVDFDVDGFVDTLYFGTTAGYVYKVILGDGPHKLDETTGRLEDPASDAGLYDPFQIFSTGGRPIYLEINAVYVPKMRANALLFGTGIRWDLWNDNAITGRFYNILDQGWIDSPGESTPRDGVAEAACASCPQPLTESVYIGIDPDDNVSATANYLYGNIAVDKLPGWYFTLDADEKLITEPFTLSGITFFTVFVPVETEVDDVCALGGESKIFVVNTVTTAGYAIQAGATERTRYIIAPTFTTQPYVESSATKNEPSSSSTANADSWTTELREINADLRKLFPPGARFANYTLDIKTIRSDTGIVFVAPVPVAVEPHNWKEF
jgi:hypothetical protein